MDICLHKCFTFIKNVLTIKRASDMYYRGNSEPV